MRSIKYLKIKNISSLIDIKKDENNKCVFPKGRVPYVPCRIVSNDGKEGWYLEFHYLDPFTGKLEHGKKRLKKEFKKTSYLLSQKPIY